MQTEKELKNAKAIASFLPGYSGDGYGYGGGAIVTIGDRSISLGEGHEAAWLAMEIANRWNDKGNQP